MTIHNQQHQDTTPLCKLQCADSTFLGYICTYTSLSDIHKYRNDLTNFHHPEAAHVPYATSIINCSDDQSDGNINVDVDSEGYQQVTKSSSATSEGYHDDNEPSQANIGLTLLNELTRYKKILRRQSTIRIRGGSSQMYDADNDDDSSSNDDENKEEESCALTNPPSTTPNNNMSHPPIATSIIIVRYFNTKLLGVTCGRLTSIYARTARLALHRHMNGVDKPYVERFTFSSSGCSSSGAKEEESEWKNIYGLCAGDTELILNVVPPIVNNDENSNATMYDREGRPLPDPHASSRGIVQALLSELEFEGMVGSKNELLPRLQNLQADLPTINQNEKSIIPIYRYPGNYSGTEWPTHSWSSTSLTIKQSVEEALQPLYIQSMNHCVTNLYRSGSDRIDHHSDKDLDLNRCGVIVSISLGCTRIMELKDRIYPHDVTRIELPSNSMFVLGPYTNARFTHAVLPKKVTFSESNLVSLVGEDKDTKKASSLNPRCSIEGGGRISLTFRDVRTFLDIKTQRLFGQGVSSSIELPTIDIDKDTGVIKNESLAKVVHITRDQDTKENSTALVIALGLGSAVGYVVSSKSSSSSGGRREAKSDTTLALLRNVSTAIISASVSYWYLQRTRRVMRQVREEKEARVFFSKKSASGNKY